MEQEICNFDFSVLSFNKFNLWKSINLIEDFSKVLVLSRSRDTSTKNTFPGSETFINFSTLTPTPMTISHHSNGFSVLTNLLQPIIKSTKILISQPFNLALIKTTTSILWQKLTINIFKKPDQLLWSNKRKKELRWETQSLLPNTLWPQLCKNSDRATLRKKQK